MDQASEGEDASKLADPALVARLEAWFGEAGPAEREVAVQYVPGFGYVEAETERDRWRRERATEAVERGTLWRDLERRGRAYGALVEPLPPLTLAVETALHRFELARWGIRGALETVERPPDEELHEAMQEQVPQAVLRDLHRPVMQVGDVELEQRVLDTATGQDQTDLIRALVRARYKVAMERLPPASAQAAEHMADLRARLDDEPWEDARPENPTPWNEAVDVAELMRWFAPEGGG